MNCRKFLIVFVAVLVAVSLFYYREYLPLTRTDAENLYYYFTEKNTAVDQPTTSPSPLLTEEGADLPSSDQEGEPDSSRTEGSMANESNNKKPEENSTALPTSVNNPIPFTPQAPLANWDALHEEACEEASLAMAHYFLEDRKVVLSKEAEEDIQKLTKFINKDDVGVEELKAVAENYYKHTGWKIINNPKIEDLEKELASGNIIIVPLAGREIGNPYYKQPGPLYHMLVVSGYDNKRGVFITQDPGTKRGRSYEYSFQTLLNAIHDWTGDKNKIKEGVSKILIVIK